MPICPPESAMGQDPGSQERESSSGIEHCSCWCVADRGCRRLLTKFIFKERRKWEWDWMRVMGVFKFKNPLWEILNADRKKTQYREPCWNFRWERRWLIQLNPWRNCWKWDPDPTRKVNFMQEERHTACYPIGRWTWPCGIQVSVQMRWQKSRRSFRVITSVWLWSRRTVVCWKEKGRRGVQILGGAGVR